MNCRFDLLIRIFAIVFDFCGLYEQLVVVRLSVCCRFLYRYSALYNKSATNQSKWKLRLNEQTENSQRLNVSEWSKSSICQRLNLIVIKRSVRRNKHSIV